MSESSGTAIRALDGWRRSLRELIAVDPEVAVEPAEQLAVENAIAAGIAVLAGEPDPEPATEPSGRPILAKDLLITTDLVLRALAHD